MKVSIVALFGVVLLMASPLPCSRARVLRKSTR